MKKNLITIVTTTFFFCFLALAILLLGTMIPFAGYHIRIVESGSMSPTIPVGSAIMVRPAEVYAIGDVVTFQRIDDSEATTHRIVSEEMFEGERLLTMRGDANDVADQRPVREREIAGKVAFHIPFLGFLLDFIRQPLGFVFVICVPAALIIYEQIMRIVKEAQKQTATVPDKKIS